VRLSIKLQKHKNGAVLAFKGDRVVAYWSAFDSDKPDYRNIYAMLNCYRYKIEWDKTLATGIYEIKTYEPSGADVLKHA